MDRRSLLKLFGAGATVAPLAADGSLVVRATAKLVEPAKVELHERLPWQSPMGLLNSRKVWLQTRFVTETGVMEMEAESVVMNVNVQSPPYHYLGIEELEWTIKGRVVAPTRQRWTDVHQRR